MDKRKELLAIRDMLAQLAERHRCMEEVTLIWTRILSLFDATPEKEAEMQGGKK